MGLLTEVILKLETSQTTENAGSCGVQQVWVTEADHHGNTAGIKTSGLVFHVSGIGRVQYTVTCIRRSTK